jgi:hypothetical protein
LLGTGKAARTAPLDAGPLGILMDWLAVIERASWLPELPLRAVQRMKASRSLDRP